MNTHVRLDGAPLMQVVGALADPLKALLVLVVVADHNDWLRAAAPDLFRPLTFHVLGFLLLAFTFDGKALSWALVRERICRYLVPFWWVLALTTLLYAVLVLRGTDLAGQGQRWLLAALIGNAPYVKAASGFVMLWYLPCMFGLSLLVAALQRWLPPRQAAGTVVGAPAGAGAATLWLVALGLHLVLPLLPAERLQAVPFGMGIAAHVLLLGLVWRVLLRQVLPAIAWSAVIVVAVGAYGALAWRGVNVELATLDLRTPAQPLAFLLQDLAGLGGVLAMVALGRMLAGWGWLQRVGRHSLLVYLLHPLVYQVLTRLPGLHPQRLPEVAQLAIGLLAAALAAHLTLRLSEWLVRTPRLAVWCVPRGWADWPPTRLLPRTWT